MIQTSDTYNQFSSYQRKTNIMALNPCFTPFQNPYLSLQVIRSLNGLTNIIGRKNALSDIVQYQMPKVFHNLSNVQTYGVIMGLEKLSLVSQLSTEYPSSSKFMNSFRRFVLLVSERIISLRTYGLISSLDLWISSGVMSCISRIKFFTSESISFT